MPAKGVGIGDQAHKPVNHPQPLRRLDVSIHARHFWRASPRLAASPWCRWTCFNPRLSFLAGERPEFAELARLDEVSIHARHFWRAKPLAAPGSSVFSWCQSKPVISGGRNTHTVSSPGSGFAVSIHARHFWRAKPGSLQGFAALVAVSIHARHFWRGKLAPFTGQTSWSLFQSTPVTSGGRNGAGRARRSRHDQMRRR